MTGDRLHLRQLQSASARGGILITFSDGTTTLDPAPYDQDGQRLDADGWTQNWRYRRVDLSAYAGKTITGWAFETQGWTGPGPWQIYYARVALVSTDGTVVPMYTGQKTITLSTAGSSGGMTNITYQAYHEANIASVAWATTHYYHGDHLGSSRQISSGDGYPVWEATYLPFGQEHAPPGAAPAPAPGGQHYKFTGKERDPESALDYMGARYYSSLTGRFLVGGLAVHRSAPRQSAKLESLPLRPQQPAGLRGSHRACVRSQHAFCFDRPLRKQCGRGGGTYYQDRC